MIRFLSKLLLLATLVGGTFALALVLVRANSDNRFLSAVIDKHTLLERTRSPKIIIVGGSSAAISIDSALIEKEFARPVVNMALHGGLGLRFMLNEVKASLQPGDLIIVSPEYQSFFGLLNGDETLLDVMAIYPPALRYIDSPEQFADLVGHLPSLLQGQTRGLVSVMLLKQDNPLYTRQAFNRYGDMVSHLDQPAQLDLQDKKLFAPDENALDPTAIETLSDFNRQATHINAMMVFVYPPIPDSQYRENVAQIETVASALAQARVPALGKPSDYTLPIDYFFDTLYHLNARGREIRTRQIIDALKWYNP